MRQPEECRYRTVVDREGERIAHCDLVRTIVGLAPEAEVPVSDEACRACCRHSLPSGQRLNPVVASMVYETAGNVIASGGTPDCDIGQAMLARDYVLGSLDFAIDAPQSRVAFGPQPSDLRWAVGMITAPRATPTIHRAVTSLRRGGFESPHIFAEPGSYIPEHLRHLTVTYHGRRLGNLGNFITALTCLFMARPDAEYFALFQDDVEIAEGTRAYCEQHFWPCEAGVVSLYTRQNFLSDKVGWRLRNLGHHRTFGALAFVFRRAELKSFLADRQIFEMRETIDFGDDAVVGEWAQRHGLGIAYHTPSLVWHIGATSSIDGRPHAMTSPELPSTGEIGSWQLRRRSAKVGLVGWNTASGLGYINRELATHAPIDRWLVPRHDHFPSLGNPTDRCRIHYVERNMETKDLRAWLRGLDWVLFAELPYLDRLAQHARDVEAQVACIPMWEWIHPTLDWLRFVDLMICPTRLTFEMMSSWRDRFSFTWDVCYLPWPLSPEHYRFRLRKRCERFVFANGTGGGVPFRLSGGRADYARKAADLIACTARQMPGVPWTFYSQVREIPEMPDNVEVRFATADNRNLYQDGDVCVQPSRWEGLGLQMLECQATGMPLVTTDAAPMNEFQPFRAVPAREKEWVSVYLNQPILSQNVDPTELATVLAQIYQTDIRDASREARSYIERQHSWETAVHILRERMCC